MRKVITYGTFDMLHYGHIRLLERAKALGDYLIVGVTSEEFDRKRGKINVRQSLMERIEAVKSTGLADKILIEEYEGQKIDDIRQYGADIFTVGSDWDGKFDYLREFCEVIYLERTEGVSSTDIRSSEERIRLGMVGSVESSVFQKYYEESAHVDGLEFVGAFSERPLDDCVDPYIKWFPNYNELLDNCDAVYIVSHPSRHEEFIRSALDSDCHVLCEAPITLNGDTCRELFELADSKKLILMEAVKTAYSTAYNRFILMVKNGLIGDAVSVDATCTSLRDMQRENWSAEKSQNSICAWGPTAMLPVFQIFGTGYTGKSIVSRIIDVAEKYDSYTRVSFVYSNAIASIQVGKGVKSEGELIVSGTKGYIYIPAPWWKTDYFEIRYENPEENKRFFYQLDGEGIRNEYLSFLHSIKQGNVLSCISREVSIQISSVIGDYYAGNDCTILGDDR